MRVILKNKNNLKCRLGFHDYEILEIKDVESFWDYLSLITLVRKICLNCGKIYDTITPYKAKRLDEYHKNTNRQTIAKQLYKQEIIRELYNDWNFDRDKFGLIKGNK